MPLSLLNNRISLSTFRGLLNLTIGQVNTNVTDIATNTANIATNTADIATNTSDISGNTAAILLKQDKSAATTLNYTYRTQTASYALLDSDANSMIKITNSAPTNLTVPSTSGFTTFRIGVPVIVYNSDNSTDDVTIVPVSTVDAGSLIITPGTSAILVMTGNDAFARIV